MWKLTLLVILLTVPALAHDDASWIEQQRLKSRQGELCCGPRDCAAIDPSNVLETPQGYRIQHSWGFEIIPYSEPMPFSIDGRLWICQSKGALLRRCVFDKPRGF